MKKNTLIGTVSAVALTLAACSLQAQLPANNLQLWFRADAGVTTNASGQVSSWADQSGNNLNAIQANANKQPLYISSGLNGLPALRFDGVGTEAFGDVLNITNSINLTSGFTFFAVARNQARINWNGLFRIAAAEATAQSELEIYFQAGISDLGSGHHLLAVNRPPSGSATIRYNQYNDMRPAVGNYYLMTHVVNSTSDSLFVNMNSVSPDGQVNTFNSFLPNVANPAYIGAGYNVGSGYLRGDIAEMIVYNATLSTADRLKVENYLAGKYGPSIPEATPAVLVGLALWAAWAAKRKQRASSRS